MKNEHRLNVFIPEADFNQLKTMDGTLKQNVCTIFAHYFAQDQANNAQTLHKTMLKKLQSPQYNRELVDSLNARINELTNDKQNLWSQLDLQTKTYALLVQKVPLLEQHENGPHNRVINAKSRHINVVGQKSVPKRSRAVSGVPGASVRTYSKEKPKKKHWWSRII